VAVLFVLEVPEYAPLSDYARTQPDLTVAPCGPYQKISGDKIEIPRAATAMEPAVWFGALVGGFEGNIVEFGDERLVIGR
jgi:hypothetical protein